MNGTITAHITDSSSLNWAFAHDVYPEQPRPRAIHLSWKQTVPAWASAVIPRIVELDALPVDPRGSRLLNVDDVVAALSFLDRVMREDTVPPWIGRLNTGGIQLTWRLGDVEVEAVFDRVRDEHELLVTVGETEWDAPIGESESLFASVVDRLSTSL